MAVFLVTGGSLSILTVLSYTLSNFGAPAIGANIFQRFLLLPSHLAGHLLYPLIADFFLVSLCIPLLYFLHVARSHSGAIQVSTESDSKSALKATDASKQSNVMTSAAAPSAQSMNTSSTVASSVQAFEELSDSKS